MRSRTPAALSTALLLLASATAFHAAPALAQDNFVQRLNDLHSGPDRAVPQSRRSDALLVPALAALQAPPAGVDTPLRAMLVSPGDDAWGKAVEWATQPSQQALLEQIVKVGEPGRGFAFLMPYGEQNVSPEARSAGVVVRLGEPPVLADARFDYIDRLTDAATLVHVEVTRLAHEKKALEGADLLIAWKGLTRQIADREFFAEKRWAMRHAIATLERLRDLVHENADQFTGEQLADIVSDLGEDTLAITRLQLPRADRLAGEQILANAFVERQGPSPEFGALMARIGAGDRPLRQFSESARWQIAGDAHANTFETGDQLRGVFGDWDYRWRLPEFDKVRKQSTDFDRMDRKKFAMVAAIADGVQDLFTLRQRYRAEAEGTRLALAVMGFKADNRSFPASLAAVRPRYIRTVGVDPYSERGQEFHFFVPIRDQPRAARELPKPHTVTLQLPGGFDAQAASVGAVEGFNVGWTLAGGPQSEVRMARIQRLIGRRAPEISATGWINGAQTMRDLRGKIVVLDVWGTWCGPCIAAIPKNNEIASRFADRGVTFVGICESNGSEKMAEVVRQHNIQYPTGREVGDRVKRAYDVGWFPYYVLVDRNGYIRAAGLSPSGVEPALEALLAEQPEMVRPSSESEQQGGMPKSIAFDLDDSTFILYSASVDNTRNWAREVGHAASDMLFWPPTISMLRAELLKGAFTLEDAVEDILWLDPEPDTRAQTRTQTPGAPGTERPAAAPSGTPF